MWHSSSSHADVVSHRAQPERLTTRIYNYVLRGFGEKKKEEEKKKEKEKKRRKKEGEKRDIGNRCYLRCQSLKKQNKIEPLPS